MAEITAALTLDAGPAKVSTDQLGASALKAARAVDGLSASQRELVARSEKVAAMSNTIDIQNKKAVNSYLQQVAQVRALAQQIGVLNEVEQRTSGIASEVAQHQAALAQQMRVVRTEAGLVTAAQAQLGTATGLTRGGINSMRSSLTSLAASLVGTAPGVAQFTGMLGTMAIGSGLMIGVLAGMSALAIAWDKIGGAARKAKKDQDDAIESLRHMQEVEAAGPAGETALKTAEGAKRIADLQRQIAEQQSRVRQFAPGSEGRVIAEKILADLQRDYDARASVVQKGEATVRHIEATSFAESVAQRLAFNQKDSAAREAALDRLARDRAEYARLLTLPNTPDNSAQIAKVVAEIKQLDDALHPKAGSSRAATRDDARDLQVITDALREQEEQARRTAQAKAEAIASATGNTEQELTEAQLLLDALREGEDAYRAQQREIAILHQLQAEGLTLADAEYEAEKKRLEQLYDVRAAIDDTRDAQRKAADEAKRQQDEDAREVERRYRQLERNVARSIEQGITDITNGKNPFIALAETLKRTVIRAMADALAEKFTVTVAKVLGIEIPADKQTKAAHEMNVAADKMLQAADRMTAGGSVQGDSTGLARFRQAFKVAGAAYGGFELGQGIGQATGDKTTGAIGGGLSGAAIGFQLAGPVGAAVGGIAGFAGGIIGAGEAARKAAAELARAKAAFDNAFDSAKAQVNHDTLAETQANIRAQGEQLKQLFAAAFKPVFEAGNFIKGVLEQFNAGLQAISDVVDELLQQAAKADALAKQHELVSYQERIARAQGRDKEADAIAFADQQRREREEFDATHNPNDPQTLILRAMLLITQAAERQKFAEDQNTKALNDLTTALHNAPTGFKVQPYTFDYAIPRAPTPTSPLTPSAPSFPQSPQNPPTLTRSAVTKQITLAPVFNIDGTKGSRALAKELAVVFQQIGAEALGSSAEPTDGMNSLVS